MLLVLLCLQGVQAILNLYLPNLNAEIIDKGVLTGDTGYIWRKGGVMLIVAFVQATFAVAAVFLGSTQFQGGRFNVAGTLVAVVVLAVGVKGLQLAGAPVWLPDLFNGVALLAAVGFAQYQRSPTARTAAIRRVLRLRLGERSTTQ